MVSPKNLKHLKFSICGIKKKNFNKVAILKISSDLGAKESLFCWFSPPPGCFQSRDQTRISKCPALAGGFTSSASWEALRLFNGVRTEGLNSVEKDNDKNEKCVQVEC